MTQLRKHDILEEIRKRRTGILGFIRVLAHNNHPNAITVNEIGELIIQGMEGG